MKHPHEKLIDDLGGNAAVAVIFSISSQAVSKWRKDGIPPARMMYLRLAYPHLFSDEMKKAA
jgi:hypothetical protein